MIPKRESEFWIYFETSRCFNNLKVGVPKFSKTQNLHNPFSPAPNLHFKHEFPLSGDDLF